MTRRINAAGFELVREFEGLRLEAYQDQGGVWTIGYGHTGPEVVPGLTCTREQAEAWLLEDLREAEADVLRVLKRPATDNQFAAMVSLAYNIGGGAFARSTVLKRFNKGDIHGAAEAFGMWRKVTVGGKKVDSAGLIRRRAAEAALFLTPDVPLPPHKPVATEIAECAPAVPRAEVAGGAAAGVGALGALLQEVAAQIEPLTAYSEALRWVFITAMVAGIVLATWARFRSAAA